MSLFHPSKSRVLTDGELGWIAGIIDGEGSLGVTTSGPVRFRLRVVMTDKPAIDRLQQLLSGTIRVEPQRPPRRISWCWYCRQRDLRTVLMAIRPYLVVKRFEADAVLAYLATPLVPPEEIEVMRRILRGNKQRLKGLAL
jgi:hypothetical protein